MTLCFVLQKFKSVDKHTPQRKREIKKENEERKMTDLMSDVVEKETR